MSKRAYGTWFFLWVGMRFLRNRKGSGSFSLASSISVLGLAIGVAALTVTLAILTGFNREYKKSILGLTAHAVVLKSGKPTQMSRDEAFEQKLRGLKEIVGTHPFIMDEGMLAHRGKIKGSLIKGVDPQMSRLVNDLTPFLDPPFNKNADLKQILSSAGFDHAVIGSALGKDLGLKVGDKIRLIVLRDRRRPVIYPLFVSGFFTSGLYEFDSRFTYVNLETAQKIFSMGPKEITGMEVAVHEPEAMAEVSSTIRDLLEPPFFLYEWKDLNANLFAALKLEKIVFFLLIVPIVMVGALTIVSALIMFLMEKRKNIAVLKALGMTNRGMGWMFVAQGLFIGTIGTGVGLVLGTCINIILARFPLIKLSPQIYFIDHLPIAMRATDYFLIFSTALLICLIGTLIPALKAVRLLPAEGIRAR